MTAYRFPLPRLPRFFARRSGLKRTGSPSTFASVALMTVACLVAIFLGLLATTANPILIGVFVGAFLGFGLLAVPTLSLWLVLIGTLFVGGMIAQFLPNLNKANWLFSMLGLLLFATAIITATMRRERADPLPWWTLLALFFPAYSIAIAVINQVSVFEFLAGFKRYFQFWGVFACLSLAVFKPETYRNVLRFLVALASIQVFFALFQRIIVVPKRMGLGGGVVAIDAVSGTFESNPLGGGSSSVLVFFVLMVFAFLLRLWLDGRLGGFRMFFASLLLLVPLGLGETKIVVVFLPMVLCCVLALDLKKRPFSTISLMAGGLALTVAFGMLYLVIDAKAGESLRTVFDKIVSYNVGSTGYHSATNLNRTTVLTYWWGQQSASDPVGMLLGHGPGASYSGEGSLVPGHLAMRYGGLAIAFTTFSGILWDFGLVGLIAFLAFNFGAIAAIARTALRLPDCVERSLAVAVLAGLLMNLVLMFMGNAATSLPSHSTLYMLLLGAAVLLCRLPANPASSRHA